MPLIMMMYSLYFIMNAFTPFLSFMIPYLVEKKGFSNKELHNCFSPFFFIASLVTSLVAFFVVEFLGCKISVFIATFIEIVVYLIFMFMPFKAHRWVTAAYILHGVTTSTGAIIRSVLLDTIEDDKSRRLMSSVISSIKTTVGAVSSWVGQDIIMCGGNHMINIVLSLVFLSISLCISLFFPNVVVEETSDKFMYPPTIFGKIMQRISGPNSEKFVFMSLLSSSAGILYICLVFYSSGIFLEKIVDRTGESVAANFFTLMIPIRLISCFVIYISSIFDSTISYCENQHKRVVIHGYIEGCAKILSSIAGILTSKFVDVEDSKLLIFPTSVVTAGLIYILGIESSIEFSYLFYIMACSASSAYRSMAYILLSAERKYKFVPSLSLFLSSIVHTSITYYSRWHGLSLRSKLTAYFYVNAFLVTCAFLLYLRYN